jgi:peptidoglycan/xylan/chitin deacetylase (PgdA/CDA1 family)
MTSIEQQSWASREPPALRRVPVLTYHSLDDSNSVISLAPQVFRRQMQLLNGWGFRGIPLGDLLDGWEGKIDLPSQPVVLTFDDGYRNLWEHAIPVLEELNFRATIFAVAGRCGGHNDWPSLSADVPRLPLLSWSELRQLAAAGFEIGAHGITHAPLPTLGKAESEWEIAGAQQILQGRLGQAVSVFAYPYGLASAANRRVAAAHYRSACGTTLGTAHPSGNRYRLRRIDMHYYRTPTLFRLFPSTLGSAYLGLRAFGRTCRYLLFGSQQRSFLRRIADRALLPAIIGRSFPNKPTDAKPSVGPDDGLLQ